MLIIGGSETFPKTFATIVRRLWEHPDQRRMCVDDPALIPDAYNEGLRYDMPTQFLMRKVAKECEFAGAKMTPGQAIMFLYHSGNHDEREFPDPDKFDILRRPPRIMSFGYGPHSCLGVNVARLEGRVCIEELLQATPGIRGRPRRLGATADGVRPGLLAAADQLLARGGNPMDFPASLAERVRELARTRPSDPAYYVEDRVLDWAGYDAAADRLARDPDRARARAGRSGRRLAARRAGLPRGLSGDRAGRPRLSRARGALRRTRARTSAGPGRRHHLRERAQDGRTSMRPSGSNPCAGRAYECVIT